MDAGSFEGRLAVANPDKRLARDVNGTQPTQMGAEQKHAARRRRRSGSRPPRRSRLRSEDEPAGRSLPPTDFERSIPGLRSAIVLTWLSHGLSPSERLVLHALVRRLAELLGEDMPI